MDYVDKMIARMDLPRIRSFLLYGSEDFREDVKPYQETLQKRSEPITKRLESIYSDAKELDEATDDLSKALTAYEYVYMELGMKAGARIIYNLLLSDNQALPNSDNL